jgi:hypothetical protein
LVYHDEYSAMRFEILEQGDQVWLSVGQRSVDESVTAPVHGDGVMDLAGDVDTAEHREVNLG